MSEYVEVQRDALMWQLLETTKPAQSVVDFGTVVSPVLAFDASTEEYANGRFKVPTNLDTSGTVQFVACVSPATGAASKNVAMTYGHAARATDEAVDASYTDEDSGDKAITATTGNQTIIIWSETVANLGWAAGDQVYDRISRYAAGSNNLSGDMYLIQFSILIPVAN